LELRLAVRGGLRPQAQADGRGVNFADEQGQTVIHYAGLKVWDADRRELPARLDAEGAGLRLVVDERQARYPLTIDPIAQQAYLKASNTGAFDRFGFSVAVSGDTVVVGAQLEDSNATGVNGNPGDNSAAASGAAYVLTGLGPEPPDVPALSPWAVVVVVIVMVMAGAAASRPCLLRRPASEP
jgi:hypothetical protein